jgi:hypothetical protein
MDNPLILSSPSGHLVFGLTWMPLIGRKTQRLALRIARQHRATHMVLAGDAFAAVGLARMPAGRAPRKSRIRSAAQNIASLFPAGTVAVLLELGKAGHWLVAVHDGAVVARTDTVFSNAEEAEVMLAQLRLSYPRIAVMGSLYESPAPTLDDLHAVDAAASRLMPLARWRVRLPLPVQAFVFVLLMVLLLPRLWHAGGASRPSPEKALVIDPARAWSDAIEQSVQGHLVHGVQGTRELLDVMHSMPVRLAGWVLAQAECAAAGLQWKCRARYERRNSFSNNNLLLLAAPANWRFEFDSMELAHANWTVAIAGAPLRRQRPSTTLHNDRHLFSAFQAMRSAFMRMQFGKSAPLPVAAPKATDGSPIPRPAALHIFASRTVSLGGPLRSASLLLPYTGFIGWRKIQLLVHDNAAPAAKSSRLAASFEGVLYEIHHGAQHETKLADHLKLDADLDIDPENIP